MAYYIVGKAVPTLRTGKNVKEPKRLTRTIPPKRGPNPQGLNLVTAKELNKRLKRENA